MYNYQEMEQARNDMLTQDQRYQPTAFWSEASLEIVSELCQYGVENFRSSKTSLGFFVPTYGIPGNGFSPEQADGLRNYLKGGYPNDSKSMLALNQFLSGGSWATADYRVFKASDSPAVLPALHSFSESKVGNPVEQFEFEGCCFSRSSLNYLLGLSLLKKHLRGETIRTVLEVGGGFGTLGEILCQSGIPDMRYIDVDIPPTSFVAQYYLGEIFGQKNVTTYCQTSSLKVIPIETLQAASVLCSWQIEKLEGQVDLFVNFISFQEMEPAIVQNYLTHVVRLGARWILLRNMKEGKNIRKNGEAGVVTPILSDDYLSMLPQYELVERNVFPYGHKTVDGFHSEVLLLRRKEQG